MIKLKDVSVVFNTDNTRSTVMDGLNLTIDKTDFVCLLGPSGCGKTTILNLVADFMPPTNGQVLLGEKGTGQPLKTSFVFQDHNIFPWKTVRQNIGLGLISDKLEPKDKKLRIEKIATEVGLFEYLDEYPKSLSGDMRQRVGIARALVGRPDILLMDEPFAALDALTAINTRQLLIRLRQDYPATVVFVTHSIDEALELGDRVIVLSPKPMHILLDIDLKSTKPDTNQPAYMRLRHRIYTILTTTVSEA